MSDQNKNLQVKQDGIVYPKPMERLNDESDQIRTKVTDGKSGSVETRSIESLGSKPEVHDASGD